MGSELRYSIGARTDTGRQRAVNEDALAVLDVQAKGLRADAVFVVADGMGGMQSGDVASREAVRVVGETLERRLSREDTDPDKALAEALGQANQLVHSLSLNRKESRSGDAGSGESAGAAEAPGLMGTTCVVGVVRGSTLHLAHVGDSRAYVLREGRLERLTRDHSFVEERVMAGDLTEEEARRSRFRNMITRAVGIDTEVQPELRTEALHAGDTILVCTDGLTTMLDDREIEGLLLRVDNRSGLDVERAAGALVDAANRKGGADNITVLLVHAQPSDAALETANGTGRRPENKNTVVDLDAPARGRSGRRAGNPLMALLALIGVLALIAAVALAVSPDVRQGAQGLLSGGDVQAQSRDFDYAALDYEAPQPFAKYLARGDLLAFSPEGYLYFVGFASGRVAGLSRTGEVVGGVTTLPVAPPPKNPVPPSSNYMATDAQGNVYISLTARKQIDKRDPKGRLLKSFKGFQRPEALAVDDRGNLYVIDYNQIKVLRVRPASVGKGSRK